MSCVHRHMYIYIHIYIIYFKKNTIIGSDKAIKTIIPCRGKSNHVTLPAYHPVVSMNCILIHWLYQWIGLRENLNRKPWFLPSNTRVSCKFSHHPVLWLYSWQIWPKARNFLVDLDFLSAPPALPLEVEVSRGNLALLPQLSWKWWYASDGNLGSMCNPWSTIPKYLQSGGYEMNHPK
jgi:hypothetical protein